MRFRRSRADTRHSVALLWTSGRPCAGTTHDAHKRKTSMLLGVIRTHNPPANERPQIHALHRASPGIGTANNIGQLKYDGTRAETRFRLSVKRTSPFKFDRWASVQSTTGSRGVRINGSNAGYTMFRGSLNGTGYSLHSPVSPSLPLQCVTVCHHISTGVLECKTVTWQQ